MTFKQTAIEQLAYWCIRAANWLLQDQETTPHLSALQPGATVMLRTGQNNAHQFTEQTIFAITVDRILLVDVERQFDRMTGMSLPEGESTAMIMQPADAAKLPQ
jgi:hypothetical protein